MKKILIAAAILGIFFSMPPKVSAYEIFWYDKNCGFNKFAKIVLYPLNNA